MLYPLVRGPCGLKGGDASSASATRCQHAQELSGFCTTDQQMHNDLTSMLVWSLLTMGDDIYEAVGEKQHAAPVQY